MDVVQDADIDWQLPNKFIPGDLTGEYVIRMCPPVQHHPDIDWQMPNNFSMTQMGMVCNTFCQTTFPG